MRVFITSDIIIVSLSSVSAGGILSQQTQSVSLRLHHHCSSFIFPPHLQLMHLFLGFLLFFKDTHRVHSCRSNHQSPPTHLRLPFISFFSTLSFLSIPLELCTITFLYKFLKSSTSISRSPP